MHNVIIAMQYDNNNDADDDDDDDVDVDVNSMGYVYFVRDPLWCLHNTICDLKFAFDGKQAYEIEKRNTMKMVRLCLWFILVMPDKFLMFFFIFLYVYFNFIEFYKRFGLLL